MVAVQVEVKKLKICVLFQDIHKTINNGDFLELSDNHFLRPTPQPLSFEICYVKYVKYVCNVYVTPYFQIYKVATNKNPQKMTLKTCNKADNRLSKQHYLCDKTFDASFWVVT